MSRKNWNGHTTLIADGTDLDGTDLNGTAQLLLLQILDFAL
jgi:hypothetical protein